MPFRQEAVLGRVDGVRTAADVSLELGRPAFHTLVDLRATAAAGFVTAAPEPQPLPPPSVLTQTSTDPDVALLRRLRVALEAL